MAEGSYGKKPLAIDLYAGLGGWTEGLLAEGFRVVGFDTERHAYGDERYPAQLVIQDVLTIHGAQFKDAALIVGSSPCQEFSYRAMPWKRAKALPPPYLGMELFNAQFRIQREACEAAGHFIPLVVENVCGAQKWVGRARWKFGSFYLWGDVPALMPITRRAKVGGFRFDGSGGSFQSASVTAMKGDGVKVPTMGVWYPPDHPKHVPGLAFNGHAERHLRATKNEGGSWFAVAHGRQTARNDPRAQWTTGFDKHATIANAAEGHKQRGSGAAWWRGEVGSQSSQSARQAASAHIAKIPLPLARWIARAWAPESPLVMDAKEA